MDFELPPGQRLGPYRLIRKIGAGGMGDVYEGVEEELNRSVAIKILRPDGSKEIDGKARFQAEARTLAKIQHANVVAIHSVGEQDGICYLAMEYVRGLPLDRFLLSHPVGIRQILDLFKQMLDGLAAAHAGGIIHRDLKPQNIMIDEEFKAKLVDFGVAKALSDPNSTNTTAGVVLGTIAYIAPELMRGLPANLQCDIYSLGLVFFFSLTGEQPFKGKSTFEVMEQIRTVGIKFSARSRLFIPDHLQKIVLRMTASSPAVRYQSVQQVLADLTSVSVEHLPAEAVGQVSVKTMINNPEDIMAGLKLQNLDSGDYRLVANLALTLQLQRGQDTDKTMNLSSENSVRIEKETLIDAMARFNSMRARVSTTTFRAQAAPPPPKSSLWPVAMLMLLVAGVVAFFWLAAQKPHSSPAGTPAKDFATADPLGQAEPVAVKRKIDVMNVPIGSWARTRERAFKNSELTADSERVWTLVRRTANTYIWRGSDGSESESYMNPFLPLAKRGDSVHDLDEEHSISGNLMSIFPLHAGGGATYDVRGMRKLRSQPNSLVQMYKLACSVGDQQSTMLMGKDFATFKVECKSSGRNPEYHETYYYADDLASPVIRERSEGPYRVMIETLEYFFPEVPVNAPADQRQPAQQ